MGNVAKHIEVIARGVCLRDGKLLVCRNLKHGHCYLPGGHVEIGEAAEAALAREFLEESGEAVDVGALCVVSEHIFEQRGTPHHELNLVFHVERLEPIDRPVISLEPQIAFEWLEWGGLAGARFLPANLLAPLATALGPMKIPHLPASSGSTQAPQILWISQGPWA